MLGLSLPSEDDFDPSSDDFFVPPLSKERRYKHFDLPIKPSREIDFTSMDEKRRFLPMLGFNDEKRKFVKNKKGQREVKIKNRPIRFASHSDAAYLESYALYLNNMYEKSIKNSHINDSVLAYRSGGGTNIHHAKSLFDEIKCRKDCSVFAMDISSFFDCINHEILKEEIKSILSVNYLKGHDYNVWNNVTKYSWVEIDHIDYILGKNRKKDGRICSHSDFINHIRGRKNGLIQTNPDVFGIPQGTPISGLYANIYLKTFDNEMINWCHINGGSYRRYSDDIALILPLGSKINHVTSIVEKFLADFELSMSVDKTDTAYFENGISKRPIQYLGFTYDGKSTLIRKSSLDAYMRKMRRGIHAKIVIAKSNNIKTSETYKRELFSRYTHLGKRRNFLRYAYKASEILDSSDIRQQVKRHMTWFKRAWEREINP